MSYKHFERTKNRRGDIESKAALFGSKRVRDKLILKLGFQSVGLQSRPLLLDSALYESLSSILYAIDGLNSERSSKQKERERVDLMTRQTSRPCLADF
jgi:hypothetical protein